MSHPQVVEQYRLLLEQAGKIGQDILRKQGRLMGQQTETIVYEIPRYADLTAEFRRKAEVKNDGNIVEVGSFTARYMNPLERFGHALLNNHRWLRMRNHWQITSTHPSWDGKIRYSSSEKCDQAGLIENLAYHEAELHLTDDDHKVALRAALVARLESLKP